MKHRITKQQWLELIAEQQQCELSAAEFCRRKNISVKNFYNNAGKSRQSEQTPTAFVQAQVANSVPAAGEITLHHGATQLNFSPSVSPQWLASLLQALP